MPGATSCNDLALMLLVVYDELIFRLEFCWNLGWNGEMYTSVLHLLMIYVVEALANAVGTRRTS